MPKIEVFINNELYDESEEILDSIGLDINTLLKMSMKRLISEGGIEFLLPSKGKTEVTRKVSLNDYDKVSTMTKTKAIRLFEEKINARISTKNTSFSSKNRTSHNYWSNPDVQLLDNDWNLILNDWINKKLYLFIVPKRTYTRNNFNLRSDYGRESLIDLQIEYNDPNFTDTRSGNKFLKFLITEIQY